MKALAGIARLSSPRPAGGLLAAASAAVVAGAFYFQHVEGLQPCPLCVAQRWAHGASFAAGLAALLAGGRRAAPWLLAATGLAFLAGAAVAGYHVAVERQWLESAFCETAGGAADSVEELEALLMATEPARCDQVPWSLAASPWRAGTSRFRWRWPPPPWPQPAARQGREDERRQNHGRRPAAGRRHGPPDGGRHDPRRSRRGIWRQAHL